MNLRERQEEFERIYLSPYASLSVNSKGRRREEEECSMRPVFQRDRDRILHCKSFRRMKHKTQVFLAPRGDHYRTRLTHTLEVSQIARSISRALRLNEDLTEAIALGHDLGHTPFGHAGERVLNEIVPFGFRHYEQSVRVVTMLENDGNGLNLTEEVIDGILNHSSSRMPSTLEGKVVRLSDKIAYVNHDIDDAIRGGIISESDLPSYYTDVLGTSTRIRLDTLIRDVIANSEDRPDIHMSPDMEEALLGLRAFMFKNVYTNPRAKGEEKKAQDLLRTLYEYYLEHTGDMPNEYQYLMWKDQVPPEMAVCDYISGMTDQYAIGLFEELFVPKSWRI